jgi:NAD(P)-dependent dehydrogenase (short-subunit alcohol dehydrogenase family)
VARGRDRGVLIGHAMTGRLDGKVALITGTGGGQGRAAALRFAAEGAAIVGCDLKPVGAEETLAMVHAAGGRMVSQAPVDLTDEDAVRAWLDFAVAEFGDFDILYNNAAAIRSGTIDVMTREDFVWTLDNEITLVFLAVKHALPVFRRRGGGAIVNISSVAGLVGAGMPGNNLGNLAHCVAKAGVIRMTEVLSVELSSLNVRVNSIAPGIVETPALAPFLADAAARQAFIGMGVIPRVGQPEDVVNAALFLVSDEASYITGVTLPVDGGQVASGGVGSPHEDVGRALGHAMETLARGEYSNITLDQH